MPGMTCMGLALAGTVSYTHTTREPAAAVVPGPQDIEWSIVADPPHGRQQPDGMMYPNEINLAGPRTIVAGEPLHCRLRAVPPAVPLSYDGTGRRVELRPELRVELLDAAGKVLAVERPAFPQATVFAARRPAYYDVHWLDLSLAPGGLPAGDYRIVAWIDTADGIPHNRVEKQVRVVTVDEARRLDELSVTPRAIATAAGLGTVRLDGGAGDDPCEAVLVPAGKEAMIPLPGSDRVAVYGILAAPTPAFTATLAGVARPVPAFTDGSYLVRERFLGVGQGGADSITLAPTGGPLRLAGIRVEPLPKGVSLVPRPGNGGKQLVVNNDGGSEGFWSPTWDPMSLPEQVNRYQGSDVSQFEFSTNLGETANYRSRYVDFYGEHFEGTWPTKGYEAQFRHFDFLDRREPRLFPWLKELSDEIGLTFWGSQRMNADYGGHAAMAELFHSRFQKEHPEMRVLRSPAHERPSFLLSYAQAAVRERRIGVLAELAEFGAAGVNLDFCRYPTVLGYEAPMPDLFRQAHGADGTDVPFDDPRWVSVRQEVMNGFMREVRAAMDEAGRKRGRTVRISVRLPATKYETFGFDPRTWIREGRVDALIPAYPGWARWFDVSHWTAMAKDTKVMIWPGWDYFFYETATAELTDADVARGLKPGYMFRIGRNDYLRRAAEAYAAGAGGVHFFNAWGSRHITLTRGISDAAFVANWRRYLDPDNLHSEIAADPARNEHLARRREAAHRRRRLIFNNDGDDCVTILRTLPSTAESLLARRTTPLVGSQVDSIFYCSLCGPKSYHPSEVSETYANPADVWVDYHGMDHPTGQYFSRLKNVVPDLIAQGTDPLQVMVEFSRANAIEVFCSMRMNDTHDGAHRPDKPYPHWPRFKEEHPEYLVGSFDNRPHHGQWSAYDYGQAAIRDRKFRRLEEVCQNYDVDGIELDFFRHGVLFRSVAWGGKASAEELDMMTELIRRLHRMTVEQGMKRGKPILIAVRVPDSVEYCRGIGLDIERWLSEGLVDILITTCYFRLNPWEYSVDLGHRYGVPVYASLSESRVNEKVHKEDGEFTRHWNTLSYRARAMEAWQAGVDGIYMFNFFNPNRTEWRELGDPKTLAGLDKLYFVTCRNYRPSMWLAGGEAMQNRTVLTPANPADIRRDTPAAFDLRVGDDLSGDALAGRTVTVSLHLRIAGLLTADAADVRLNGHRLGNGTLTGDRLVYPVASEWVRRGANRIEVGLRAGTELAGTALEVMYRGDRLLTMPGQLPWRRLFEVPNWVEEVRDGTLILGDRDAGPDEMVNLMYPWDIDAEAETVVEARVKVVASDDPLAVTVRLANGEAVEYLTLGTGWIGLHHAGLRHDMDTTSDFRTYRIMMQERDIRVYVDDELRLDGTGRLTTPADDPTHWLRVSERLTKDREMWNRNSLLFGSASGPGRGEALWEHVSFTGTRRPTARLYDVALAVTFEKAPVKTGDNILKNHDFESGNGLPEHWRAGRGAESVTYVKEAGKVGSRHVLIEPTKSSALVQDNIPVEHGKTYRVSGYIKTEDFSCKRGDLVIIPTGWPASYGISLGTVKGTSDWTLFEQIVTIDTESRDGRYHFYINIMESAGRIRLDGVKVEEVVK